MAAILMAAVAWLTSGGDEQPPTDSGPLRAESTAAGGRPDGCRTDDSDNAIPKSAPPDVQWRVVEATRVPTSPSAGPKLLNGPLNYCFAHTPMGAVLAAHVIPAQLIGDGWRTVINQQLVPGLGRDIFESQRATVRDARAAAANVPTYLGFRIVSYTPDEAVVSLLIKNSMAAFSSTMVSMRWSDGDWKVQPGTVGDLHSDLDSVRNTDIFVKWSE
nr:hypothetical protein [Kibdelosporangium sp. MJ126-NF4]